MDAKSFGAVLQAINEISNRIDSNKKEYVQLCEEFETVARAVVLCDSTDPDHPVMDGELYREAMDVIKKRIGRIENAQTKRRQSEEI